jgi:hypothetical protein
MTPDEVATLAAGFIAHTSRRYVWDKDNVLKERDRSDTQGEMNRIFDAIYSSPADLWEVILEVLRQTEDKEVLAVLAAGPLEDYLGKCGESVIERVEAQAAADPKFKHLLGGVWKNAMSDEVWRRVCACRSEVW